MGYNTVTVIILFCSNYFDVIHQRQIKLMRRQLNLFTLQKDKRYLILECVPEERNRLLDNYIEELFRSGPPPPPTASAPSNRSKMHWSTESYFASVYFLIQTQSHCFAHCIVQGNRKLQSNILNIEASYQTDIGLSCRCYLYSAMSGTLCALIPIPCPKLDCGWNGLLFNKYIISHCFLKSHLFSVLTALTPSLGHY